MHSSKGGVLPEEGPVLSGENGMSLLKSHFLLPVQATTNFFRLKLLILCICFALAWHPSEFSVEVTYNQFYDLFHTEMNF